MNVELILGYVTFHHETTSYIMLGFVLNFSCAHPKFTCIYGHGNTKSILFQLSYVYKCLSMMISDQFLYILTKDKSVEQHNSTSHLNFTSVGEDLTIVKLWTQSLEMREDVLWIDS